MRGPGDSKLFAGMKLLYACRKPTHLRVVLDHMLKLKGDGASLQAHLQSTMEWLCRAQDVTGCGGISAGYGLTRGWKPAFPETTGYIIPTFLQYASLTGGDGYPERAVQMGEWEVAIQLPSGAVRGGVGINDHPLVFDTGQVILGWCALYGQTGQQRFLDAAVRAADWLLSIQDGDGKWSRYAFQGIPHTYHTRVAWSLLEVYRHTGSTKYRDAAEKNVTWALTQAQENGWFLHTGFSRDQMPLTHTIAYTLRGLLESSFHLAEGWQGRIMTAVRRAVENVMVMYQLHLGDGHRSQGAVLPAALDAKWESRDRYTCLVGNAQFSILMLKLFQLNNDVRFLNAARRLIDFVKARQSLGSRNLGIRGGLPGSYPIWGKYIPYGYPNWAAKFFVDALLLMERNTKP